MIRTYYHHGEDTPATDLSKAQIGGALHDAAGVLWLDVETPDAESGWDELRRLASLPTALAAAVAGGSAGDLLEARDGVLVLRAPVHGAGALPSAMTILVGPNYVVSIRTGALEAAQRLGERVAGDTGPMERGAPSCAAALLDEVAQDYRAALNVWESRTRGTAGSRDARLVAAIARGAGAWAHLTHRLAWDMDLPLKDPDRIGFRDTTSRFTRLAERAADLRDELQLAALLGVAGATRRVSLTVAATLPALTTLLALLALGSDSEIAVAGAAAAGVAALLWAGRS